MNSKQEEIAELEKKLHSLEALRDELEAAVFERKKAELQTRLQALLNTGGGAVTMGNVQAARDFIGRDKIDIYVGGGHPANAQQAETCYRQELAGRCGALPLRGVDPAPGEGAGGRQPPSLAIHLGNGRRPAMCWDRLMIRVSIRRGFIYPVLSELSLNRWRGLWRFRQGRL